MRKAASDRRRSWRGRSRLAVAGALVALAGTVGACASLGRAVFQEPVVNFRGLSVRGLGLTGGALDVQLSLYNPNSFDLESTRLSYNLLMDTVRVADGLIETRQTFRSGDSTVVTIPVNFTYAGLG